MTSVAGARRSTLLEAPVRPIAAGDDFVVRAGCDKRLETCRDRFANVVNFRGFPHIPGQDTVIRYPNRGDANSGRSAVTPADPERVIAAARGWLGTPYHDQASVKGVGCDCLGLVRGVWRDLYGRRAAAAAALQPRLGRDRSARAARRGSAEGHDRRCRCRRWCPAR